jgi:hypothetical protein
MLVAPLLLCLPGMLPASEHLTESLTIGTTLPRRALSQ